MSARWSWLIAVGLATSAGAQILDFGEPGPPPLPTPTPYQELVTTLRLQSASLASRDAPSLSIESRRVLADLLEADPLERPVRTIALLTLANSLPTIDAQLAQASDGMSQAQAAAVLERLLTAQPDGDADLRDRPESELGDWDRREFDRWLRESMIEPAVVAAVGTRKGWVLDEPVADPPSYDELRESISAFLGDGWSVRQRSRFDELAALGHSAEGLPGFADASRRLRVRLARSMRVADVTSLQFVSRHRAADSLGDRWRSELAAAIDALLDPVEQARAIGSLDGIAVEAELVSRLDALPPLPPIQSMRQRVVESLSHGPVDAARLATADSLITSVEKLVVDADERAMPRELRACWRLTSREFVRSIEAASSGIASVLEADSSPADPAIVSMVSAVDRAARDRSSFVRMGGWIADPSSSRPEAASRFVPLARRFITISEELTNQDGRERAIEEASGLLTLSESARALEASLSTRSTTVWAGAAQMSIDEWLADPQLQHDAAEAVRLAARLDAAIGDAALLRDIAGLGSAGLSANAWPGFELSEEIVALLSADMQADVEGTIDAFAEGRLSLVGSRLDRLEREHALARVIVAIERGARQRGLDPADRGIAELIAGSPDRRAWLVDEREDIARLCVLAECLSSGRRPTRALDEYLDGLAMELLVRIGRDS